MTGLRFANHKWPLIPAQEPQTVLPWVQMPLTHQPGAPGGTGLFTLAPNQSARGARSQERPPTPQGQPPGPGLKGTSRPALGRPHPARLVPPKRGVPCALTWDHLGHQPGPHQPGPRALPAHDSEASGRRGGGRDRPAQPPGEEEPRPHPRSLKTKFKGPRPRGERRRPGHPAGSQHAGRHPGSSELLQGPQWATAAPPAPGSAAGGRPCSARRGERAAPSAERASWSRGRGWTWRSLGRPGRCQQRAQHPGREGGVAPRKPYSPTRTRTRTRATQSRVLPQVETRSAGVLLQRTSVFTIGQNFKGNPTTAVNHSFKGLSMVKNKNSDTMLSNHLKYFLNLFLIVSSEKELRYSMSTVPI